MKKQYIIASAIALLLITGVITLEVVKADSGFWDKVANIAGQIIGNSMVDQIDQDKQFGATGDTNFTNIVVAGYSDLGGSKTSVSAGSFADATTTIVSIANPFGITATSTVELARLNITTGATSTASIACGGATTAYAAPTYDLITTSANSIATGTIGVIENGIAAAVNGNSMGVGGGAIQKITLTPNYPYFTCRVTSVYTGAFTEVTNAFAGNYEVKFRE